MKKVNVEYVCDFCRETVGKQEIRHFKIPYRADPCKKWEKIDVCDSCFLVFIRTRNEMVKKEKEKE